MEDPTSIESVRYPRQSTALSWRPHDAPDLTIDDWKLLVNERRSAWVSVVACLIIQVISIVQAVFYVRLLEGASYTYALVAWVILCNHVPMAIVLFHKSGKITKLFPNYMKMQRWFIWLCIPALPVLGLLFWRKQLALREILESNGSVSAIPQPTKKEFELFWESRQRRVDAGTNL